MKPIVEYLISKSNKSNVNFLLTRSSLKTGYIIQTSDLDPYCVVMKKDFNKVEDIFPNKKYVKNRLEEAEIGVLINIDKGQYGKSAHVTLLDDYNEDLSYIDKKWEEYNILYIYPLDIDITNPENYSVNNLYKTCHNKKSSSPLWKK